MRRISFVSCDKGPKEQTLLHRSLQRLNVEDVHFYENNSLGLPLCYNRSIDQYVGDDRILVLVHSDVTIADVYFQEKLSEASKRFNLIGLVGTAQFNVLAHAKHYGWRLWPPQYLSGAIEHVLANGTTDWFHLGPTPRRCVVMDGVLLAMDMKTIGTARFDPRFDFHLYDLDFCLTAHHAGLTLGTTNLYVQHASMGESRTDGYRAAFEKFREKWKPRSEKLPASISATIRVSG